MPVVAMGFILATSGTPQVSQSVQRQQASKGPAKAPAAAVPPMLDLESVAKVVGGFMICCDTKQLWSLTVQYHDKLYPPKDGEHAAADISEIVHENRARRALKLPPDDGDLIEKYQADISRLLFHFSAPLLYNREPVRFALRDNNLTLILASLGSTNIYNTLRLDAKERATREIQATVLPAIKRFAIVSSTDIKNFGLVVAYGSKDFSDELSTEGEIVALVASSDSCRKLADAELTEEQFVDMADVYLIDRDTIFDVRKIKVSIGDNRRNDGVR
jgi:hypothetical protein